MADACRPEFVVEQLTVSAFRIPTEAPESDGTWEWDSTTLVVVEAHSGDVRGVGYTYADTGTAKLIDDLLARLVVGRDAMNISGAWDTMVRAIRDLGRPGICSMAIAAVDIALWDLKARLLALPLVRLLGAVRNKVPVYGSGGFTSYVNARLQQQFAAWVTEEGMRAVKMRVGRRPADDAERVRAARQTIGNADLLVAANGAYSRKEALAMAARFVECGASWFEEPVSSDDLDGLRMMRDRAPVGVEIAAGAYGYDLPYFRRMMNAEAIDVVLANAGRCAGITEFLRVNGLCESFCLPLSAQGAPNLHAHVGCAANRLRHLEYHFDHARIEQMLFDGALPVKDGALEPDCSRPGMGLEFKRNDAAPHMVYGQAIRRVK